MQEQAAQLAEVVSVFKLDRQDAQQMTVASRPPMRAIAPKPRRPVLRTA
jgi:hypothetical protein